MRKLLVLCLLLIASNADAQQYQQRINRLRIDSTARIPVFNTLALLNARIIPYTDTGAISYCKEDSNVYRFTGGQWLLVGGSTGVPTSRTINTTSPLAGGGDLTTNRTISIGDAAADGSTKGASTYTANDFNASSGLISLDYTNGQAASGSNKGFLTPTNWTTFNNKLDGSTGTYTPTVANTTNVSSSTSHVATYMRIGDIVTVYGSVNVTATTIAAVSFTLSLPIASNLTAFVLNGSCTGYFAQPGAGTVKEEATLDVAQIDATFTESGVSYRVFYNFQYQVL